MEGPGPERDLFKFALRKSRNVVLNNHYVRKLPPVTAIRYATSGENLNECKAFLDLDFIGMAYTSKLDFFIRGSPRIVKPGNWIIRLPDYCYSVDDTEFGYTYQKA